MVLSPELTAVCGTDKLPRSQVVKATWAYIKQHDLQNPENKREILCDKKLKRVFGVDRVTMFAMNKLYAPHLTKASDEDNAAYAAKVAAGAGAAGGSSGSDSSGDDSDSGSD